MCQFVFLCVFLNVCVCVFGCATYATGCLAEAVVAFTDVSVVVVAAAAF